MLHSKKIKYKILLVLGIGSIFTKQNSYFEPSFV